MDSNSILNSVKKDLGIVPEYTHFDPDIIMDINTAFSILTQLGVGPKAGFSITDDKAVWTDFITDGRLEIVKTYVAKKTKQMFDPPSTGPLSEALNKVLNEMEWRINVMVDPEEASNE